MKIIQTFLLMPEGYRQAHTEMMQAATSGYAQKQRIPTDAGDT